MSGVRNGGPEQWTGRIGGDNVSKPAGFERENPYSLASRQVNRSTYQVLGSSIPMVRCATLTEQRRNLPNNAQEFASELIDQHNSADGFHALNLCRTESEHAQLQ